MTADNNYAPVHAWVLIALPVAFVFCIGIGTFANIPEVFGAGIALIVTFMALLLSGLTNSDLTVQTRLFDPEPTLYRYEVERIGYKDVTVYAADVKTAKRDFQTVHFIDYEGNTIAIYSHVLKVQGRPVESEED